MGTRIKIHCIMAISIPVVTQCENEHIVMEQPLKLLSLLMNTLHNSENVNPILELFMHCAIQIMSCL